MLTSSFLGDSAVRVTEIVIGMPDRGTAQRASCLQNPQKGVKCISCNQNFKTHEFMIQHWHAKHNRDDRQSITQYNSAELKRLESRVEESKRQKLAEDQELLQQHQLEKHKLYDDEEQKTNEKLAARDLANAETQDKMKISEQKSRSLYDDAAETLQLRQARQVTVSSLEFQIQQEFRDIVRLLQSVPLEVHCPPLIYILCKRSVEFVPFIADICGFVRRHISAVRNLPSSKI